MLQNPAHMSSKTARCRERKKAVTRSNPKLVKMRFFFLSVAASLVLAPAVQSGRIVDRQATAPFDCGQVRVDSPNTTYKGFVAADLDSERRYVVTKTDTQKRLLTSFENNTLFTLVSQAATQLQDNILTTLRYRTATERIPHSAQPLDFTGTRHPENQTLQLPPRTTHTSTALLRQRLGPSLPTLRRPSTKLARILLREGKGTTRASRRYSI